MLGEASGSVIYCKIPWAFHIRNNLSHTRYERKLALKNSVIGCAFGKSEKPFLMSSFTLRQLETEKIRV